jgi:hypothetical protein
MQALQSRTLFQNYLAIILTLSLFSGGCALFSTEPTPVERDPIALAARRATGNYSDEEGQRQFSRRFNQEREIQRALDAGEIVMGMKMNDVLSVWGKPGDVETAGDPQQGNQRWIYNEGLTTRWRLKASRIIYFEEGRVVGWENARE